jgi:very-short-patch-repair endonuclease
MIAPGPRFAVMSCCGAPAKPDALRGHKCIPAGRSSEEGRRASGDVGRVPTRQTKQAGRAAEDALAAQLTAAGHEVVTFKVWLGQLEVATVRRVALRPNTCVTQYPWGIHVGTRHRADFAFPLRRLLVEVEGGCHGIQKQRKSDILRAQLAASVGYTILRVLPEQVHDKDALALIARAVEV